MCCLCALHYGINCYLGALRNYIDKYRIHYLKIILFVNKVLTLLYILSGNTGSENLFYQTRRNSQRIFKLPKVNKSTNMFKRSEQYIAPKYINQLSFNFKSCPNLYSILKELKYSLF